MARYKLKVLRVMNGLTLKEAAEKLGISTATLSNWERGLTYPDALQIKNIEILYHTNYEGIDFLYESETE
jgi:transcriptional regulator with XRE-family HTH domain